ncbi:MAG: hypothetical protein IPH33_05180 [Bacteroidetes bacterium]|nr:hypothetical protein [Bacteroidota bacterium]
MKKLLFALFLTTNFCNAQDTLKVEELNRSFSLGNKNAFVIEIPQADLKKVQSNWKTYLKKQNKRTITDKNGEITLSKGPIQTVSADSITVFSTLNAGETKVKLSVFLMMSDSSFLSSEKNSEAASAASRLLRTFGINEYKNAVNDELLEEQNKLSTLQKKVTLLDEENEDIRKEIKDNERAIDRKKDEIKSNEQEQELKSNSIFEQKKRLNNYVGSDDQKSKEQKQLKQLEKEKSKLQDNKDSLLKKIDDLESENRANEKKIALNTDEKIPEAQKLVDQQKEVVKNVETKMNNIK